MLSEWNLVFNPAWRHASSNASVKMVADPGPNPANPHPKVKSLFEQRRRQYQKSLTSPMPTSLTMIKTVGSRLTDKKTKKKGAAAWWSDMLRMKKEVYSAFRDELSSAFPDHCIYFLSSKCSRDDKCDCPHTVPEGYAAIKDKYKKA